MEDSQVVAPVNLIDSSVKNELKPSECIADGWYRFKENARVAIFGSALVFGLDYGGRSLPGVGGLYGLFISPAIFGGATILCLNLARNRSPGVRDVFKGFERYWSFLGAYWLFMGTILVCLLPIGAGLAIDAFNEVYFMPFTVISTVMSACLITISGLMWVMVLFLIADGFRVLEAFRKSVEITKGYRKSLLVLLMLTLLVGFVGILALFVGIFVAFPVNGIALASAYIRLRDMQVFTGREA